MTIKSKSILSDRLQTNGSARATGKIRCGTKELTKAAKRNEHAVKIFEAGKRDRLRASEIEKLIREQTDIANPMYPKNTEYFNVSATDFVLPLFAQKILEVYGEDRGEGRQLYKMPVLFHSDHLLDFFPHRFESHTGPDKFRSAFDDAGNRVCEALPAIKPQDILKQRSAGIRRVPRRDWQVRSLCEPRVCKEFQTGQCKFRGQVKFFLPLISGLGLLVLETSSEYAAENIWATLDQIKDALGYIPRSNPQKPGQPVFMLSKVQEERVYYDENGEKKKGLQWVPRLTADLDMGSLLASSHAALAAPTVPAAWLANPAATAPVDEPAQQATVAQSASVAKQETVSVVDPVLVQIEAGLKTAGCDAALFYRYVERKYGAQWRNQPGALQQTFDALQKLMKYGKDIDLVVRVRLMPLDLQIDEAQFAVYTREKFGDDWHRSFPKMRQIIGHMDQLFAGGRDAALQTIGASHDLATPA